MGDSTKRHLKSFIVFTPIAPKCQPSVLQLQIKVLLYGQSTKILFPFYTFTWHFVKKRREKDGSKFLALSQWTESGQKPAYIKQNGGICIWSIPFSEARTSVCLLHSQMMPDGWIWITQKDHCLITKPSHLHGTDF